MVIVALMNVIRAHAGLNSITLSKANLMNEFDTRMRFS